MILYKFTAFLFVSTNLLAQRGSAIVGIDYSRLTPPPIARGQLVTLIVRGIMANSIRATNLPLPLELSGVTAMIEEPRRGYRAQMPILQIDDIGCGVSTSYVCDIKAITMQVPTDIPATSESPSGTPGVPARPVITISESGISGFRTEFELRATQAHLLGDCDLIMQAGTGTCRNFPTVTHSDGTLVTGDNPGRPGEDVVLYAVGLGVTTPTVPAGQPAPSPGPVALNRFYINFASQQDIPPVVPWYLRTLESWPRPLFVGMVAGFVGLYQVNVRLPMELPPRTLSCGGSSTTNVTITLASDTSLSSLSICMQP